ncbi:MAG: polysaccharide pyruvyl transferase family protein [Sedimentisphaerales bacterium]
MKIGIVTLNSVFGYGAVLQAYALQTYLRKEGHDPFFINCEYHLHGPLIRCPPRLLSRLKLAMIETVHEQLLRLYFSGFQKKHLNIGSHRYKNYQEIKHEPPIADAYVCGSDQIWHPYYCYSRDEGAVWLDFGDERTRRIAYAASFGDLEMDNKVCAHWAKYAQRLHSLSVREEEGVDMVRKLGRSDAAWVPDPTLLLDAHDYDPIEICMGKINVPSIFSYPLVSNWEMFTKAKATVCEEMGGPFHDCRPTSWRHSLFHGGLLKPGQWISRLRNAKFVLTDSYHGLLFSLIFHRPFIVLRSAKSSRIISVLRVVGLQHRAVTDYDRGRIKDICREKVNWDQVDARIQPFREIGFRFLRDALS